MKPWKSAWEGVVRLSYLVRAFCVATLVGLLEGLRHERFRQKLGAVSLVLVAVGIWAAEPVRTIPAGHMAVRFGWLTGSQDVLGEGPALVLPVAHQVKSWSLQDLTYRPATASYRSHEGLALGVHVIIRYAVDADGVVSRAATSFRSRPPPSWSPRQTPFSPRAGAPQRPGDFLHAAHRDRGHRDGRAAHGAEAGPVADPQRPTGQPAASSGIRTRPAVSPDGKAQRGENGLHAPAQRKECASPRPGSRRGKSPPRENGRSPGP